MRTIVWLLAAALIAGCGPGDDSMTNEENGGSGGGQASPGDGSGQGGTSVRQVDWEANPCVSPTYQDRTYSVVQLGNRCWFAENLHADRFANGDPLPYGKDSAQWVDNTGEPLYCRYGHVDVNADRYGHLYSGYAITDPRRLCPIGWHVSTDADWQDLEMAMGASPETVGKQGNRGTEDLELGTKAKSGEFWFEAARGTDDFGFRVLPAGSRLMNGRFVSGGSGATVWTADVNPASTEETKMWYRGMGHPNKGIYRGSMSPNCGFSVRCVRD